MAFVVVFAGLFLVLRMLLLGGGDGKGVFWFCFVSRKKSI